MFKKEIAKTYIDGGRVKIVDSYGREYEKEINVLLQKAKLNAQHGFYLMLASIFFISFFISHLFFLWLTPNQMVVLAVLGIVLGIISADKYSHIKYFKQDANEYSNEYNLAKHSLQNEVLYLEKVLAQHTKDINALRLNNVMDFSDNFKKTEKQTAYL